MVKCHFITTLYIVYTYGFIVYIYGKRVILSPSEAQSKCRVGLSFLHGHAVLILGK
jgi:hypothetical protein